MINLSSLLRDPIYLFHFLNLFKFKHQNATVLWSEVNALQRLFLYLRQLYKTLRPSNVAYWLPPQYTHAEVFNY